VIKKILRGKVILRVGDKDEILTIEERATSKTEREYPKTRAIEKGTAITVSRSNLQQSLENIHQLLSQARVRPHFRDGKTDGLAISNIKAGSLFAKLGLKNGDIVQGIDGRSIKSPDDVMEVYRRLRSGSEVALQISRRGEQKILNYKFR
jgi:general secretion pathway protein C